MTQIGAQIESFPAELQPSEAKKELLQDTKAITQSSQQEQMYSEPSNLNMMTSTLVSAAPSCGTFFFFSANQILSGRR